MLNVLFVLGTRPELIKLYPVIKEVKNYPDNFQFSICFIGMRSEALNYLLNIFEIPITHTLEMTSENQTPQEIAATVLQRFPVILDEIHPDLLIVQGDKTMSMASALCAYYKNIKIAHVEAGLRSHDIYCPMPDEMNRRVIDEISNILFAPTENAKNNLIAQGRSEDQIVVTGSTAVDTLLEFSQEEYHLEGSPLEDIPFKTMSIVLVSVHRRENFGQPIENICEALKDLAERHKSDAHFVFPVDPDPRIYDVAHEKLSGIERISLLPLLDYVSFVYLMKRAFIILSDSGGIQEEAPSLHVPVLLLREKTERPEAVENLATRIIGIQKEQIIENTSELLEEIKSYRAMANVKNPYGEGNAAQRIIKTLLSKNFHDVQTQ